MKISISSLGGAGEIGMNMYIYETNKYTVIVDCGVKFANSEDMGVDLIIPDFSYLKSMKHKKILLVITHAHEDHTGAIPFLLKEYSDITLLCGRYSFDVFQKKLKEHNVDISPIYIEDGSFFDWGDFQVKAYPISHSIHNTYAIFLNILNEFKVLHISDYKIDTNPVTCIPFPINDFIELGKNGIDCLMADSTNISNKGFTKGERQVIKSLDKIFEKSEGRIFFTTFASNTERMQIAFDLAEKYDRKVVVEGSSILKNIDVAKKYNKLKFNDNILITRKQAQKIDDRYVCFITSGSQGEPGSVTTRISENDYANIKVKDKDIFIFSSRIIPGNEKKIINVINNIYEKGGKVITSSDENIHVSGHSSRQDSLLLLNLLRPKYLIPIHGEIQHLIKHKEIAIDYGMKKENVLFFLAGEKVIFKDGKFLDKENIKAGKIYVDLNTMEFLNQEALKDRKRLAINGAVIIITNLNKEINKDNILINLVGIKISNDYIFKLKEKLEEYNTLEEKEKEDFPKYAKEKAKKFFKKHFSKKPIINVVEMV